MERKSVLNEGGVEREHGKVYSGSGAEGGNEKRWKGGKVVSGDGKGASMVEWRVVEQWKAGEPW